MDGASPYETLKFLVPRVLGIAKAAAAHSLWMSPTSSKWDLRTELTVHVIRSMMSPDQKPSPIGKIQATTLKDPGAKGKVWVAKADIPAVEDGNIGEVIFKAIDDMGESGASYRYTKPETASMRVEWTGFRPSAAAEDPLPDISEEQKYKRLMEEPTRSSKTTVLYFHGGAYYLCGFGTHRVNVSNLAKACNGRALNVEYRLAPQAAFPSQLLDALNAYLYLLYPPPGALHEPVAASDVVFAGDSAGGNLCFALLQLLLQLGRTKSDDAQLPTVRYHGMDVQVPLPAGVTANSGWFDITRSMPSINHNVKYDYLPVADHDDAVSRFPRDDVWPTTPPRGDIFTDLSLLCHPLVSPLAAKDWTGAPPLWIQTGEEMLTDEDAVVAVRAESQGVAVHWEQYEAMPHVFNALLAALPTSKRCFDSWGSFCKQCVEGTVQTNGTWIEAKTGKEKKVDVAKVADISWEDAVLRMKEAKARREKGYDHEGKMMPKPSL